MNLFKTLQVPEVQRYWIRQARVPICLLSGGPKTAVDRDGATLIDLRAFLGGARVDIGAVGSRRLYPRTL